MNFSLNQLTERFFKVSFHVSKYLNYQKSVMVGPDQYKTESAISGLPCRDGETIFGIGTTSMVLGRHTTQ